MATFTYFVSDVRRLASGGSRYGLYDAEVELVEPSRGVVVEVLSTMPAEPSEAVFQTCVAAIREAAELVLRPRGFGAIVQLSGLGIHDVDSSANHYHKLTVEALSRAVVEHLA